MTRISVTVIRADERDEETRLIAGSFDSGIAFRLFIQRRMWISDVLIFGGHAFHLQGERRLGGSVMRRGNEEGLMLKVVS